MQEEKLFAGLDAELYENEGTTRRNTGISHPELRKAINTGRIIAQWHGRRIHSRLDTASSWHVEDPSPW